MTEHRDHKMHANSMKAHQRLSAGGVFDQRLRDVHRYIKDHPGVTDHDVRDGLGFAERNDVSPVITKLKQQDIIEEGDPVMGDTGHMRRTLWLKGTAPPRRQHDLF